MRSLEALGVGAGLGGGLLGLRASSSSAFASRWAARFLASAADSTRALRCSTAAVRLAARFSAAVFFVAAVFAAFGLGLLLAPGLDGVGLVET